MIRSGVRHKNKLLKWAAVPAPRSQLCFPITRIQLIQHFLAPLSLLGTYIHTHTYMVSVYGIYKCLCIRHIKQEILFPSSRNKYVPKFEEDEVRHACVVSSHLYISQQLGVFQGSDVVDLRLGERVRIHRAALVILHIMYECICMYILYV